MFSDGMITVFVLIATLMGLAFSFWYWKVVEKTTGSADAQDMRAPLVNNSVNQEEKELETENKRIEDEVEIIQQAISDGANAFLSAEYKIMGYFVVGFSIILFVFLGAFSPEYTRLPHSECPLSDEDCRIDTDKWGGAGMTVLAFVFGSCTSMLAGMIGMKIAVFTNWRTAVAAQSNRTGWNDSFNTAFKGGAVMGFALTSLGVLVLWILIKIQKAYWGDDVYDTTFKGWLQTEAMYEAVAGYGLGGSSIALFGRVGGGIYTKAADVGADLCKISQNMKEDSPQNPAVIADNVGDNVGDIAGMGADLFGSFAESSCAAMVVASQSPQLFHHETAMYFPMVVSSLGILTCLLTSFIATHVQSVDKEADVQTVLKNQLIISTVLTTPAMYLASAGFLPDDFTIGDKDTHNWHIFICIACGLWAGLAIGVITEYYTSHSYRPVQEVSESTHTGVATNIIYGLALGYKSVIIPIICLCITTYTSFALSGMFGVASAALGILSTMSIGLTIDAYGPICDNAGGIAEMAGMHPDVREKTDALDAAGNTTAAIGKGFAIGSAALVSLALFGAFCTTKDLVADGVNILRPFPFAGLLFGAMLPYWFTAMTMKSVGIAAGQMIVFTNKEFENKPPLLELCRLFDEKEDLIGEIEDPDRKDDLAALRARKNEIMDQINHIYELRAERNAEIEQKKASGAAMNEDDLFNKYAPNYNQCIAISTEASLQEMIAPGVLVMVTPLIVGFVFGIECLAGTLAGSLVSGVQIAISASNTGGAWDNAKKWVEQGGLTETRKDENGDYILNARGEPEQFTVQKGSPQHKAAVVGDTVGDPLKDTSGPALNILIKLSAIISLVFARAFASKGNSLIEKLAHA